jgi:hypothetical protein
MNALMVAAPVFVQVVTEAGRRCECTGACGRVHRTPEGRCGTEQGLQRLFVAPRDPAVPAEAAWRAPVEGLAAWCGPCLDAARRAAVLPGSAVAGARQAALDLGQGLPASVEFVGELPSAAGVVGCVEAVGHSRSSRTRRDRRARCRARAAHRVVDAAYSAACCQSEDEHAGHRAAVDAAETEAVR